MRGYASVANNQVTWRRIALNHPTAPDVKPKDTYLQYAPPGTKAKKMDKKRELLENDGDENSETRREQ